MCQKEASIHEPGMEMQVDTSGWCRDCRDSVWLIRFLRAHRLGLEAAMREESRTLIRAFRSLQGML